jgi:hypothetical protein
MAKILGSALYFLYISPQEAGHGTILIEQNASVLVFWRANFPFVRTPCQNQKIRSVGKLLYKKREELHEG